MRVRSVALPDMRMYSTPSFPGRRSSGSSRSPNDAAGSLINFHTFPERPPIEKLLVPPECPLLKDLLAMRGGRDKFQSFLKIDGLQDNLDFLLMILAYRVTPTRFLAEFINETYLVGDATRNIILSSAQKEDVLFQSSFTEDKRAVYDLAAREVYYFLETKPYLRFLEGNMDFVVGLWTAHRLAPTCKPTEELFGQKRGAKSGKGPISKFFKFPSLNLIKNKA